MNIRMARTSSVSREICRPLHRFGVVRGTEASKNYSEIGRRIKGESYSQDI